MNALTINNYELGIKEYNGQRVVTLKDVDLAHGRPNGTARKRFNDNKKRFIENEDYFKVCTSEIRTRKIMDVSNKAREDITLLTETGYLMLVKSFTDDLAWDVQRQLVKNYFRMQAAPPQEKQMTIAELIPQRYQGEQVLTTRDVEKLLGVSQHIVRYVLKQKQELINGLDFRMIKGPELLAFKNENARMTAINGIYIIYQRGVIKIAKHFGIEASQRINDIFSDNRKSDISDRILKAPEFSTYTRIMSGIMDEMSREWDYSDCTEATDRWFEQLKRLPVGMDQFNRIAEKITHCQAVWETSGFKMGFKAATMLLDNNINK